MSKDRNGNHVYKVWLEIEKGIGEAERAESVRLMNKLLDRLNVGGNEPGTSRFFLMDDELCYGSDSGYVSCPDNGHYFSLKYLSGEGSN